MDNLARCAMLAKRDGMSYGQWMAIHGEKQIKKKKEKIPEGWKPCEWCKKLFRANAQQRFCEPYCRNQAYAVTHREKLVEKNRKYRERYHERKKKNESCG